MEDITNFENTKKWPSIGAGFGIGVPLGAVGAYLAINSGINVSNQISTGGAALAVFKGGLLNYLSHEIRQRRGEPLNLKEAVTGALIGTFTGAAMLMATHGADVVVDKVENYLESMLPQGTVNRDVCVMLLDGPATPCPQ